MLVLGGFVTWGQNIVTFNLTYNGKAMNYNTVSVNKHRTRLVYLLCSGFAYRRIFHICTLIFGRIADERIILAVNIIISCFAHKKYTSGVVLPAKPLIMYIYCLL